MSEPWKKCSSCRSPIGFSTKYWVCSVSTCQRSRTGLYFCSVNCWDAHLADANHREAWALDKMAPSKAEWEQESSADAAPPPSRKTVSASPARKVVGQTSSASSDDLPRDILIVVSKLKKYIKAKSGLRTSDDVVHILSDQVRKLCDQAIRRAHEHERKTVLDRDFSGLL